MRSETTSTMSDLPRDDGRSSAVGTWFLGLFLCSVFGFSISGCATSRPSEPVASDRLSVDRLKLGPSWRETGRVAPMTVSNPGGEISPARVGEASGLPWRSAAGAHRRHRRSNRARSRDPLALRGP